MSLGGKSVVVTGAACGIGRTMALFFSRQQAKVCIADLGVEAAEETAAAIRRETGGVVMAMRMDVSDEAEVNAGMDAAAHRLGGVDVLVSNAGIQALGAIADISFEQWKKVLAVHLDGGFLTTRAALRHMISQRRGGSIILMGSLHSYTASARKGPYVAAKHALVGLCRTVAKEAACHDIRVNAICPGVVRTTLIEKQIPELARELGIPEEDVLQEVFLRNTVDGEFTTEEDLAEVAVFLASFPTKALTGQSICVSHGWHML